MEQVKQKTRSALQAETNKTYGVAAQVSRAAGCKRQGPTQALQLLWLLS